MEQSVREQRLTCNRIFRTVTGYAHQRFTGQLEIRAFTGQSWQIYVYLGRLVWATGGVHPIRRWRRHFFEIDKFLPHASPMQTAFRNDEVGQDYRLLLDFVRDRQLLSEQMVQICTRTLDEVFFDIVQVTELSTVAEFYRNLGEKLPALSLIDESRDKSFECEVTAEDSLSPSRKTPYPWMESVEKVQKRVQEAWEQWVRADLAFYSPNFAPRLQANDLLAQQTSPQVYQNLAILLDGTKTLRDLATRQERELITVARSLVPHLRQQWVELLPISDESVPSAPPSPRTETATAKQLLAACVSPDTATLKAIESGVTARGWQFLAIANPVEAMPLLLEKRPDLIFLEMKMPMVGGAEICSQIRSIKRLREQAVVLIIDSFVDRLRAKLAGADLHLSRPLEPATLEEVLQQYARPEK